MEEIERVAQAMNDKTRILIVAFLLKHGKSCVCELESSLGIFQSRVSRHLKILKDSGFVSDSRDGKLVYYDLNRDGEIQKSFLSKIASMNIPLPNKNIKCEIKDEVEICG